MINLRADMPSGVNRALRLLFSADRRPDTVSQDVWLTYRLADALSTDCGEDVGDLWAAKDIAKALSQSNQDLLRYLAIKHTDGVVDRAIRAFWKSFSQMRHALSGPGSPVLGVGSLTLIFVQMIEAVTRCVDDYQARDRVLTTAERVALARKVRHHAEQLATALQKLGHDEDIQSPLQLVQDVADALPATVEYAELVRLRTWVELHVPVARVSISDVLGELKEFALDERPMESVLRVNQSGAFQDLLAFAIAECLDEFATEDRAETTYLLLVALAEGSCSPTERTKMNLPALDAPTRDRVRKRVRLVDPLSRWDRANEDGEFQKRRRLT